MKFQYLVFLFLFVTNLSLANANVPIDTLEIEQKGYSYFLSKLQSFLISYGDTSLYFDTTKNRIFFSGKSNLKAALDFSLLNRYKKNFILEDSIDGEVNYYKSSIFPDTAERQILIREKYVVYDTNHLFEKSRIDKDIRIEMTNRYYQKGFYYQRIIIDVGIDWYHCDFYIKFDVDGNPIDHVISYSIS